MANEQISRDEQRIDEERNHPSAGADEESLAKLQAEKVISPVQNTLPNKKERQAILGETLTEIG